MATQVRVALKVLPQPKLVTVVPKILNSTVPHSSLTVGSVKSRLPTAHSLVLFGAQRIEGLVVSRLTVTVVLQLVSQSLRSKTETLTECGPRPNKAVKSTRAVVGGPP